MSYSQYAEEEHILHALEGVQGVFLDVGAWHPKVFSNTRALYELGWSGIFIEPSPGCMLNLLAEYGKDNRAVLIQAAVASEAGLLPLHVSRDAVSTTSEVQYKAWENHAEFEGVVYVPVLTFRYIFERFGGAFEFINIDTEGTSVDLFADLLSIGPRPRCICVEHDGRIVEANQFAEKAHYRQVHCNGTNLIFEWTGKREK